MKPQCRSLKARLILTFAMLILLSTSALSFVIGRQAEGEAEQKVGSLLGEQARHMINTLDKSMWTWTQEVEVLSSAITISGSGNHAITSAMLNAMQKSVPTFSWIGLTDDKGTVLASTGNVLLGQSIANRPVFQNGRTRLFAGDVHDAVMLANLLPNPTGDPMKFVDVSAPVRNGQNHEVGVLAAHLSWAWARDVEKNIIKNSSTGEGVEMFVIARDGTVLLGKGYKGHALSLPLLQTARKNGVAWDVQT